MIKRWWRWLTRPRFDIVDEDGVVIGSGISTNVEPTK